MPKLTIPFGCFLCPGNTRINGETNPDYEHTFVFDNDFAALTEDSPKQVFEDGLLKAEGESGICRVICFSPRHDLTLALMDVDDIVHVVDAWVAQYEELGIHPDISYAQIFENRGAMMGCSNPHPHGQIWASRHLPNEAIKESTTQLAYHDEHGKPLLLAYLEQELALDERILFQNEGFVVLVPYWAVWPFETMVLPKRHIRSMEEMTADERLQLAEALSKLTIRYDNLFKTSFPYSMGFHQRPVDGEPHDEWQMPAHFYPPLLRSATVKKFMVGFELLGSPQRDLTPEQATQKRLDLPETHYLKG
ncbi:UDP-glucose--hexose-1-phosphate uridylyltransferase [Martelella mediterranea]|uniref:UDP-glucose--hexose-1-phosphate uridylyltransferase n=1 Tax=Martelella mediterranea TaxID=293089 RepID=UPI001FE0E026|nr:UDP-glucose--hexose-1-phosphate uridylyltransferase [Martelella mediterranea]